VFSLLALAAPAPAAEKPNLLVVMTDDQRAEGTLEVMPETRRKIGHHRITAVRGMGYGQWQRAALVTLS
jgi:hypothetical protein